MSAFQCNRFAGGSLGIVASLLLLAAGGCSSEATRPSAAPPPPASAVVVPADPRVDFPYPVMLGIDVLEAESFALLKGKRIGLLTHPAGVNRRGESTIDVLRRAPQVKLVALFGPEHGIRGTAKASQTVGDEVDARTGLPVYSLYGSNRRPTEAQLRGLDAMVVDLQDIGVRSYTFNVVMRYTIDACFQQGVEVIVLDRPNPLGGQKVDGPGLDREWFSGVGAYAIPYVHGLTIGELARWAAGTPGGLEVSEERRKAGRLTVVPMRGWRRSMRWPETGLKYVPTSQNVTDFAAVVGYAMIGLGCEYSGFKHGIGTPQAFRVLAFDGRTAVQLEKDLTALKLPGLRYHPVLMEDAKARKVDRVYVEVADWEAWNPVELSFHLHRLACVYAGRNPFAKLVPPESDLFNKHVGSSAYWAALRRDGRKLDVEHWLKVWRADALAFQERSRTFWLYP